MCVFVSPPSPAFRNDVEWILLVKDSIHKIAKLFLFRSQSGIHSWNNIHVGSTENYDEEENYGFICIGAITRTPREDKWSPVCVIIAIENIDIDLQVVRGK